MRKFFICLLFLSSLVNLQAQSRGSYYDRNQKFNATLIGLKAGFSSYNMAFGNMPYSDADNNNISNLTFGAFVEMPIKSVYGLSVGAEAVMLERGYDIKYRFRDVIDSEDVLEARYIDFRLPVSYRFLPSKLVNPYVFIAPGIGFCYAGENRQTIGDLYSYSIDIRESDAVINNIDFGFAFGAGLRCNLPINWYYVVLKLDVSYYLGLMNTYSKKVLDGDCSYINVFAVGDNTFTTRYNRGFEATISIGFPLIRQSHDACMGFGNRKY
ncbi:MAG: outer membrane beta-barrel protein [Candidatus Limimorpha sp.]